MRHCRIGRGEPAGQGDCIRDDLASDVHGVARPREVAALGVLVLPGVAVVVLERLTAPEALRSSGAGGRRAARECMQGVPCGACRAGTHRAIWVLVTQAVLLLPDLGPPLLRVGHGVGVETHVESAVTGVWRRHRGFERKSGASGQRGLVGTPGLAVADDLVICCGRTSIFLANDDVRPEPIELIAVWQPIKTGASRGAAAWIWRREYLQMVQLMQKRC